MHLAAGPGPTEMRRVLGYRRAQRAARQEADEHRQMLEAGDGLLDADRGDMQLRHVGRQVGVTLVGADHEGAGLGDREIAAGHAGIGGENQRARRFALRFRQIVNVAVLRIGTDRA